MFVLPLALPKTVEKLSFNVWHIAQPQTVWDVVAIIMASIASLFLLYKPWERPDPYNHVWFEKPQSKNAEKSDGLQTRDIALRLEQLNTNVVLFWGSQSGTAQAFAARLERHLRSRFALDVLVADLSDYEPASLARLPSSSRAVFLLSTFGDGDASDNATEYIAWLQAASPHSHPLQNLRYAAFGLGDSNYQHFNRVARQATTLMDRLGAVPVLPLGLADAAKPGVTEDQFVVWKDGLLHLLQDTFTLKETLPRHVAQLAIEEDRSLDIVDLHRGFPLGALGSDRLSSPMELPVTECRELFSHNHTPSCLHVELDLSHFPQTRYKTGDYLAVWPANSDAEVDCLLAVLGLTARRHVPVLVKPLADHIRLPVPTPSTFDALFRHYLEIGAPVGQDLVRDLVQFAPSPDARRQLENLSQDRPAWAAFVGQNHVTLGRLLQWVAAQETPAPPWSLPLSFVLQTVPPLRPRLYSISSSSTVAPRHPSITALVVQTPLADRPDVVVPGLTSTFLRSHCLDRLQTPTLHAAIRKSKFRPPASFATPLVMIAAGSGLAPFRGFVLERARLAQIGRPVGRTVLFFGCRHPDQDYIYRQELETAMNALPDAELVPVFSRAVNPEQPHLRYVQDVLRARAHELGRLVIDEGARVYICGRAAMGRDVCAAIREAVAAHSPQLSSEKACSHWWDGWRRGGSYIEDVWG
ncbi:NADPH cytochrome p450 reductase [Grosmannia clavigera kw1407]|uniref:NADPH cytochrome p450 reductase n=1 Tax=Grosmannia clavigera (strain kw1407 / UAMH 11150) TaxID=655863 RepID=F0XBA4_GROCL|nr:NADPH cytochrome p450 reductase [Grosmannia clavigera kw1407]EFX05108.1 NADPH cytochrome p450 reductase [Grosmannia clavigera kw1407]